MNRSTTKLVLIPSYNTGAALLQRTVSAALEHWRPVWVVIDGSTDGSDVAVRKLADGEPHLRVITRGANGGKGAAVETGANAALEAGFTHLLLMDADGQHPADRIPALMTASDEQPEALVMGAPRFGADAPAARLKGRKLTIWWTNLETLFGGLGDTLFGMRVYPVNPLTRFFQQTRWGRGFDFDPEAAVRLFWMNVPPVQVPVACRYLPRDEGGVSHFHYLRDNILLTWLHVRLVPELLLFRWRDAFRLKQFISANKPAGQELP